MRWGLIGTGRHADQKIAPALTGHETEQLYGVAASALDKAATFAKRHHCRAYPSQDSMMTDPAIDAIFICTPNDLHRAQTEAAAAAGKHVLVEKPMALAEADCEAMIRSCENGGVKLGVGFQLRHHPVHVALRKMIASGELGEIVIVRGEWHTEYGPWTNWRADQNRAGSDILAAVGVHVVDLLNYLVGADIDDVVSLVDISRKTRLDQTIAGAFRWMNGAIGTMTVTRRARARTNNVSILGTKGSAVGIGTLGMNPAGLFETTVNGHPTRRSLLVPDLYAEQFKAFAHAVARNEEPNASGIDGLRSVKLAHRLLAAAPELVKCMA
jgi:1,5-anhydro-D-fructose reductase (1,5-anhydro-D-mannitol-forming)